VAATPAQRRAHHIELPRLAAGHAEPAEGLLELTLCGLNSRTADDDESAPDAAAIVGADYTTVQH